MILDEFNGTAPLVYSGTNMTGSCSSHSKCILHLDFFTFFAFWGIDQVFLSCRTFTNLSRPEIHIKNPPSEIFKKTLERYNSKVQVHACFTGGEALSLRFGSKDVECFVVDKNIKLSEKLPVSQNAMTFKKRSSAPREILFGIDK